MAPARDGGNEASVATTWQGWVGPGIQNLGTDATVWTDHTDARPTLLSLTGLKDDYSDDGRVISQILASGKTPPAIAADAPDFDALATANKQLDAPFGQFAKDALTVSTNAVATTSPGDATYKAWDAQLAACENLRAPLAQQIDTALWNAAFNASAIVPETFQALTAQANTLVTNMHELSGLALPPRYTICSGAQ